MLATFQTLKVFPPTRTSPPKVADSKNHQRLKTNFLEPFGRDILNGAETINKIPHGIDILPSDCKIRYSHVPPPPRNPPHHSELPKALVDQSTDLFPEFRPCLEVFLRVVTVVTDGITFPHTVDGSEIWRENQLRLVVCPIIYRVLAPSQVVVSDV